jgi:hypothetical protein
MALRYVNLHTVDYGATMQILLKPIVSHNSGRFLLIVSTD